VKHRGKKENIPHARNNWVWYHFNNIGVVPRQCAMRSIGWRGSLTASAHLQLWLIETSAGGEGDREIDGLDSVLL
jgi:hypothetical protein